MPLGGCACVSSELLFLNIRINKLKKKKKKEVTMSISLVSRCTLFHNGFVEGEKDPYFSKRAFKLRVDGLYKR